LIASETRSEEALREELDRISANLRTLYQLEVLAKAQHNNRRLVAEIEAERMQQEERYEEVRRQIVCGKDKGESSKRSGSLLKTAEELSRVDLADSLIQGVKGQFDEEQIAEIVGGLVKELGPYRRRRLALGILDGLGEAEGFHSEVKNAIAYPRKAPGFGGVR